MSYTLIDPPITPFSPVNEIKAWIEHLQKLPDSPERAAAIADAEELLNDRIDKNLG